jgi:hypothetical protein
VLFRGDSAQNRKTAFFKRFFRDLREVLIGTVGRSMNILGFTFPAGAWLAPMTGIAVLGVAAALILLRDHLRLERHALDLQAENEQLRSELGRLAGSVRPARGPRYAKTGTGRSPEPAVAPASPRG